MGQTTERIRLTQLFVDGRFVDAADGTVLETHNPATGAVIASVAAAQLADVDAAVRAARRALEGPWSRLEHTERGELLRRAAQALRDRAEECAIVESLDTGKPLWETRGAAPRAAERLEFYADLAQHIGSSVLPSRRDFLAYTLRQPLGVVAGITPWNFPLPFCTLKAAPALAAGNTVVLKPAEQAPLTALLFAEACRDAGIPDGVVNVLPGFGPTAGRALVEHDDVAAVSFTGSTAVGRAIAGTTGTALKRAVLELGGKSPNIVFADADLAQAARTAVFMFAYNQGQVCSAGTRLLVEESIHDDFMAQVLALAERATVGDPLDDATDIGAVITPEQLARIERYVEIGSDEGAELVSGGGAIRPPGLEGGWFHRPTVFAGVRPEMRIAQEEIFGPVLAVMPFRDTDEAARLANTTDFGLSAAVWTNDVRRAHRLAARIEAGLVFINTMNDGRETGHPVAGWKASGLGVENGLEGYLEMTRPKTVILNLGDTAPAFRERS